ncbi:MAG: methylenetetrahydrofolate reductase [Deltaproteobacteria bacterium]|nr:methylenetetrahydrofolate reductase [Deltaproteobacteria bacterium]MBW1924545.1 methylenetetrahydrofolate reductase [Deltaproteobacteria bacterium]RLB37188.1 MAG: 5,10-methylenetetrahydrofolate reductase [Deltaproteobacteria bacterium]
MSLKEKIETGQFVVLGELEPPKGTDFSHMVAHANRVRNRLDAFVVPEMANAVMKASSLGGCACLNREGLEPVFQACCRDRNRLALQADILAAGGLGIDNIMVVPGEEIAFGDHPRARAVHDLSLTQALEMIRGLCSGKDMSGIDLQGTPDFLVGSNLNAGVTGGALDLELEELSSKIDLGVRFVITTPVFDLDRFEKLLKRLDRQKIAVIPTVLLLKSAGMARYIDRNIPHISIPSDMIQSIQKASDKLKRCVEIAGELIAGLKAMEVGGVMISTIGWEDKLPLVLDQARLG